MIYNTFILNKNYDLSHEDILKIREKKFRKLLRHAYTHSKFYHNYYNDNGIKKSDLAYIPIENLPPIDKSIFIENFDDIVTDKNLSKHNIEEFIKNDDVSNKKFLGKYTIIHSSGSTGTPTIFVYDKKAWEYVLAAAFRACKGEIRIRDVISEIGVKKFLIEGFRNLNVLYIAATEGRFAGVMAASSGISGFGFNPMLLNINIPLDEWYDKVVSFMPRVIIGYPSAIKILCDMIRENGLSFDIFRVVSCGEPLTKELRDYFESVFNTDIFDLYGSSESLIIGLGRKKYDGFYIFDDINYVEANGNCIYLTSLYNFTQPLIRYKLTDIALAKERNANEYLPFTKINGISGRNEDMMWFINDKGKKDFLHPLIIDDINIDGIIKYQFIQHSYKDFEVDIEISNGADFDTVSNKFSDNIRKILNKKSLTGIRYTIKRVDRIPIDSHSGKCKLVVRDF
ncbi:phenylacetate--CoA ligase family protein [Thermoanaerobacterium sp. RBIITD]|uniref:phenylacetate--CoA ligase family protein n=1 Tax=Thermoanaerobacterium sp. RBIITD TaxID=1550240 RepID=UPI000BC0CE62|nr:phenylacetate--CoA ligase family protein [Thermoanaerobacterium sp. RBIITD]SNX53425.1 phenylacetate-CoA ligase [Thermoanaerobacterium sp. RBIITD]